MDTYVISTHMWVDPVDGPVVKWVVLSELEEWTGVEKGDNSTPVSICTTHTNSVSLKPAGWSKTWLGHERGYDYLSIEKYSSIGALNLAWAAAKAWHIILSAALKEANV